MLHIKKSVEILKIDINKENEQKYEMNKHIILNTFSFIGNCAKKQLKYRLYLLNFN